MTFGPPMNADEFDLVGLGFVGLGLRICGSVVAGGVAVEEGLYYCVVNVTFDKKRSRRVAGTSAWPV